MLCCRDESGTISYDEFKNVLNANVGPDAIPFDFDWYVALLSSWRHSLRLAEHIVVTGSNSISARRMERTSWAVGHLALVRM